MPWWLSVPHLSGRWAKWLWNFLVLFFLIWTLFLPPLQHKFVWLLYKIQWLQNKYPMPGRLWFGERAPVSLPLFAAARFSLSQSLCPWQAFRYAGTKWSHPGCVLRAHFLSAFSAVKLAPLPWKYLFVLYLSYREELNYSLFLLLISLSISKICKTLIPRKTSLEFRK